MESVTSHEHCCIHLLLEKVDHNWAAEPMGERAGINAVLFAAPTLPVLALKGEKKPECMNGLIVHAGLDKVSLTVVGHMHRERQMQRNMEQIQPWVTLVGEEWGTERGTQVNRIMKQTLRQMNIIERYIAADKDESAPSGWKTCPTTKKKTRNKISLLTFFCHKRCHIVCRFFAPSVFSKFLLYRMLPWVFYIYLNPSLIKPSTSFNHRSTIVSDY